MEEWGYREPMNVGGGTKDRGLGPILGSFQPQEAGHRRLSHWIWGLKAPGSAVKPWPSFLTSLGFSFLISKIGCS